MRSWVLQNTNYLSAACTELRQSLRLQTREAFDFSRGRLHEPETGLHPYAVELVAAMMRWVSYDRQVVATQFPVLVDAVAPEDVIFTTTSRGDAQSARVPPAVWRRWQEGGCTLSDLWLSRPGGWDCESELSGSMRLRKALGKCVGKGRLRRCNMRVEQEILKDNRIMLNRTICVKL